MNIATPEEIIRFWFEELTPKEWFLSDPIIDTRIKDQFLETHAYVASGGSADWRTTPLGRLAEIIVLDQFSRNMFRGTAEAFAYDETAYRLAAEAVGRAADRELSERERQFLYMPYMHSESQDVHEQAIPLFSSLADHSILKYELAHKEIIDRFGRYPHRNQILGRTSTPEELEFLKTHKGW